MSKNNKGIAAQLHLNTKATKPEVKTQAAAKAPILDWINYNNKTFGNNKEPITAAEAKVAKAVDQYGNAETATDRIQDPKFFQNIVKNLHKEPAKKAPRMSAKRSWQVIKQSMDKDELAEHYKNHPEDKPAKLEPVIPDPWLTAMLGDYFE